MSTHSVKSAMLRGIGLPVRFVCGGVLILTALLLLLPSVAFAFTPVAAEADPPQEVAQAGVSVVRLLVTYAPSTSHPGATATLQCTGLGVLVRSWAAISTEKSSWVLTDGNLVNPTKMTCSSPAGGVGGSPVSKAQLAQIQVLASSGNGGYSSSSVQILTTLAGKEAVSSVTCQDTTSCSQGLALIGFPTPQVQPYIDLAPASSSSQQRGIELVNPSAALPVLPGQAGQYLTPQPVSVTVPTDESGMPVVDAQGKLTGMHLVNTSPSLAMIDSFLASSIPQSPPTNALHDNWDNGIQAYYQSHNYTAAQSDFQQAANANPQFQAATTFMNLAAAHLQTSNGGGVSNAGSGNTGSHATQVASGLGFSLWQVSVAALVVLLLLVVIVSLLMGRARRQRELEKFKEDERAAEYRAAMDAQRIAEMEQRQVQAEGLRNGNGKLHASVSGEAAAAPPVPVMNGGNIQSVQAPHQMSPVPEMHCPQCGHPVSAGTQVCPNCNLWLSPTDSGLHLRTVQPPPGADMGGTRPLPPQYQQQPVPQQVPQQAPAQAVPPLATPASSYAPVAPNYAAADQPTAFFGFSGGDEATVPYNIRRVGDVSLGLAVGTRTDPGIKRKHKPNEDSLFAAQGAAMFNASPQQFGLFVVADGMGGHANGQDASRLAIQTIIDYLLPRLSSGNGLDRNALIQLLVEGVQRANQAVFQSNMQHHADMGTTMTTALVVGPTAYVANVGDSRTYLYRDQEGLKKITNDHSVVASLVEAGIIKPDDIYTHPKRNQIYRSLGEKPSVEVDSFIVDLRPGDKLLLCTDGLWDMVRDPAIQEVLRTATANPEQTGDALIHAALKGGGEDNVSVIVVYVTESAEQSPVTGIRLLAKPETVQMPPM